MRRILLLLAMLTAAGCVNRLAQRQAFLNRFVGQPETVLVQALGVPDRSYRTGGIAFLAYVDRRIETLPSPFSAGPWWLGWYNGGFPPQVVTLECDTTFQVQGGIVRSYVLRGNDCG